MCIPLRCEDGLATGKESRSGRIALERGRRGVSSPLSTDSHLQCVSCPPRRAGVGVAVLLLPQLCGTDSFLTSPTLNIGGDSKNSLMWQNGEKKIFPSATSGCGGTLVPLCLASGEAIFKAVMASEILLGCNASFSTAWHALCVSAATGLREELAFLSLSFPPPNMNYNADSIYGVLMVTGRKMHCLTS